MQETLTRAWRMRAQCRTPRDPRAWVSAIAHNEGRRYWARSAREEQLNRASLLDVADTDWIDRIAQRADVATALEQLPAADRRLLSLRYEHDQTQAAIASRLNMPEGTVKVRLHRARSRVRAILEP